MIKRTLLEDLQAEPYRYEFFQAVRLLQQFNPQHSRLGLPWSTSPEVVRLRALPAMSFPPSELVEWQKPVLDGGYSQLTVACFGLYGAGGALPNHYTQMILDLERDVRGPERRALRDWFDIFNHRLASLFYRAWEKYRIAIPFERGAAFDKSPDAFTSMLLSFVGMGQPALRNRFSIYPVRPARDHDEDAPPPQRLAGIEDVSLLYYTGLLAARRPRNAWGLAAIVKDYFELAAKVQQLKGQWLSIPPEGVTQLGSLGTLGFDAVAGSQVWNLQSKFRMVLGPLAWDRFLDFVPDRTPIPERKSLYLLMQLIRFYVGVEFDFEVQVLLDRHTVPAPQLDSGSAFGVRLGWNSWLVDKTPAEDLGDAVFQGEEVVVLG
jgi:type VI secretion system protein ImpH